MWSLTTWFRSSLCRARNPDLRDCYKTEDQHHVTPMPTPIPIPTPCKTQETKEYERARYPDRNEMKNEDQYHVTPIPIPCNTQNRKEYEVKHKDWKKPCVVQKAPVPAEAAVTGERRGGWYQQQQSLLFI